MRNAIISLVLLLLSGTAWADDAYKVVPDRSTVGFSISHFASRATGTFHAFDGTLRFSKKLPEQSSISFVVQVNSLDTKSRARDSSIRDKEYFDTATHPTMTFTSTGFRRVKGDRYMVTGTLTIKGHSKPISVPVELTETTTLWATGQEALRFQVTFEVDRTEFGVGGESSLLGSEVAIDLDLEFRNAQH